MGEVSPQRFGWQFMITSWHTDISMPELRGEKTGRASSQIPLSQIRALKQMAKDNQRSTAAEIRIAISNHLKKDGRLIG